MNYRQFWATLTIIACLFLSVFSFGIVLASTAPVELPSAPSGIPASVVTPEDTSPFHVLLVDKSLQTLYLFKYRADGIPQFIKSFNVATGKKKGDKVNEGDKRTPEGVYFFTKVYHDRKVTIFGRTAYHMNYPDPFDIADGRNGNGIYLHGTNRPLGSRTTNGCVTMNNTDLDFLSKLVKLNDTPIIISNKLEWIDQIKFEENRLNLKTLIKERSNQLLTENNNDTNLLPDDLKNAIMLQSNQRVIIRSPVKKVNRLIGWHTLYLSSVGPKPTLLASLWQPFKQQGSLQINETSLQVTRRSIMDFLQKWVTAWESRNVDNYMKFYSKNFYAYGMTHKNWQKYKSRLARLYKNIDVQINNISIKPGRKYTTVQFNQTYISDKFNDYGLKRLKLIRINNQWKIYRENWKPLIAMETGR